MSKALNASSRSEAAIMKFTVTVCHDETAHVWYVHDSDLPGLRAEAFTFDELVAIIEDVTPDLVGNLPGDVDPLLEIPVCVQHLVLAKREHAA